ncbi:MAG: glycosyltransferase family 2 protein [Planctomycetaceae bacterium]
MKLIIQIPCFNEEHTLPQTYRDLPRKIEGIDEIEVMIIDDGSTDDTVRVARDLGVDHIIRHSGNRGLAATFATGVRACLQRNADIIVNTDGDNQYRGEDIRVLVQPLLAGEASVVVGDRRTAAIPHFSPLKRLLQRYGSLVVRKLSGAPLQDAVSGFRAFTRDAAMQLNIVTSFSYTIETLIQAGAKGLPITSVPVRVNPKTRESRLFTSIRQFICRQLVTMFRSYLMYHPARVFLALSGLLLCGGLASVAGLALGLPQTSTSQMATIVASAAFFALALNCGMMFLMADLQRNNRRLIEMTLETVRQLECGDLPSQFLTTPPAVFNRPDHRRNKRRPGHGSEIVGA